MSTIFRQKIYHVFKFANGTSESSNAVSLEAGAFGTLLCTAAVNAKNCNFETVVVGTRLEPLVTTPADFEGLELLSTDKPLATGANPFDADEVLQMAAGGVVKMTLDSNVSADTEVVLIWGA
jgi:hypothetical protein